MAVALDDAVTIEIQRAWKTECKPNKQQEELFWKWAAASRRVYNWALEKRIERYNLILQQKCVGEDVSKPLTQFDQGKELTALIRVGGDPLHLADIPSTIREHTLIDIDAAFKHFFRKLKERKCQMRRGVKKALAKEYGAPSEWPKFDGIELWTKLDGFPRFKSARDFKHSFRVRGSLKSDGYSVKIPKMDPVRLKEKCYFPNIPSNDINSMTISWSAGRWYISMQADWMLEINPATIGYRTVYIDFDIPGFCHVSANDHDKMYPVFHPTPSEVSDALDGKITIPATDPLYKELKKLRRMSRGFSRKCYDPVSKQESNRRAKHRLAIQKFHARIARRREHAIHQLSTDLVRIAHKIYLKKPPIAEELMGKKDGEGLPYNDAAWGELIRQIEYKAKWVGIDVEVY